MTVTNSGSDVERLRYPPAEGLADTVETRCGRINQCLQSAYPFYPLVKVRRLRWFPEPKTILVRLQAPQQMLSGGQKDFAADLLMIQDMPHRVILS